MSRQVYKDSMSKNMETECLRMRTELLGEVHSEVSALQVSQELDKSIRLALERPRVSP